jgi:hypothetical protein
MWLNIIYKMKNKTNINFLQKYELFLWRKNTDWRHLEIKCKRKHMKPWETKHNRKQEKRGNPLFIIFFCNGRVIKIYPVQISRQKSTFVSVLDLGTSWRWVVSFMPWPLYPREKIRGTHWIAVLVDLRACMDDVEKRKFLTLPGLELRLFGRSARSQSLYYLRYPGTYILTGHTHKVQLYNFHY